MSDSLSTDVLIVGGGVAGLWLNARLRRLGYSTLLVEKGVLGGVSLGRLYPDETSLATGLVVAVTETATAEDIQALEAALKEVCQ